MTSRKVSFKGVKRRKSSGPYYFEARFSGHRSDGKFYCTKIKSPEEGALCYDIVQRYSELEVVGEKRKAAVKLNYPEYSRTLQLEPLRGDFNIRLHKEEAMEIILKQAQAAAKNLPESPGRFTPVVASPSPSNRSSSHQNVHGKPPVAKQDLPGVCKNQLILQELSELGHLFNMTYLSFESKVIERQILEGKVAAINEDSGIIFSRESYPVDSTDLMAHLKQLIAIIEKIPGVLEMTEQGYKSQHSKCLELRKSLEDHHLKVFPKILMEDGNEMSCRERTHENEILPRLHEDCSDPEESRSTGRPYVQL